MDSHADHVQLRLRRISRPVNRALKVEHTHGTIVL
jgi:hypothetical protein